MCLSGSALHLITTVPPVFLHLLIKSFLNSASVSSHSLPTCVWVLQGLNASCWGDQCEGTGCQPLESHWRCGHSCPVLPASGVSGVWASATGASEGHGCQPMEWKWSVFPKPTIRGTGVTGSVPAAGAEQQVTAHVMLPADEDKCLCSPQTVCVGLVCLYMYWQAPSWTRQWVGDLRSEQGYQVGRGSVLVFMGTCKCGKPVEWMCGCTQLDQPETWGPMGDLKSGQWCWVGRRNLVAWAWVLYVGAVEGSTLFVAIYVTGHISVLCVCVWTTIKKVVYQ